MYTEYLDYIQKHFPVQPCIPSVDFSGENETTEVNYLDHFTGKSHSFACTTAVSDIKSFSPGHAAKMFILQFEASLKW